MKSKLTNIIITSVIVLWLFITLLFAGVAFYSSIMDDKGIFVSEGIKLKEK